MSQWDNQLSREFKLPFPGPFVFKAGTGSIWEQNWLRVMPGARGQVSDAELQLEKHLKSSGCETKKLQTPYRS